MPRLGINKPEPEITPLASMQEVDDGIMLWYGDKALSAMDALRSYIPLSDLQLITLTYSVIQHDYEVDGPNLFSSSDYTYSADNHLWIEDILSSKPVVFIKQQKVKTPSGFGYLLPKFKLSE